MAALRPPRAASVVGRDREVAELSRLLDEARAGQGGAVFLVGEAGIGKTRLATDATDRAAAVGMRVLRGRGSPIGPVVPYRPLTEALLSLCRAGGLPADGELGPYRRVLGRLVPDWAPAEPDGGADGLSLVVLAEAVLRLTAVLGRDRGCLLLLDDLQDADAETLAVVEYLADNLGRQPLALLATLRDEPSDALEMAHGAVQRDRALLVGLDRLDRDGTARMVARCLDAEVADLPASMLDALWEDSEGVPYVVEELLHGMVSSALLVRTSERWQVVADARAGMPASLVRKLARRTDRLGDEGRRLLSAGAVLGRRFPLPVVQAATGIDERTLLAHLREATAAQLVAPDEGAPDWYAFRHPLTAEGLLAQLQPAEKALLCRVVADAVQERYPGLPGEWCALTATLRLDAGDPVVAARLFAEAGSRAVAAGAAGSAITLLERAHSLVGEDSDPELRADVLQALLPALAEAGRFDRALQLAGTLDRLAGTGLDASRRAALRTRLARVACLAGRWSDAAAELAAARDLLGDRATEAETAATDVVEAFLALGSPGPDGGAAAEGPARRAAEVADRLPLPEVAVDAWQALGLVARSRDLTRSNECFRRARAVAEAHRLSTAQVYATIRLGTNLWLADGDVRELERARADAARLGMVVIVYTVDANLAVHAVLRGEFDRATELVDACLPSAGRLRLTQLCRHMLMARAAVAAHRGRRREMEQAIEQFRDWGGDAAPELSLVHGLAGAFCALLEDDPARARQELARAAAVEEANPSGYLLTGRHGLALLLDVLAGEVGRAELDAAAAAAAGGVGWNRQFGLLARAVLLGRDGRPADAAAAVAAAGSVGAGFVTARHLGLRLVAEAAHADGWGEPADWLRAAEDHFYRSDVPAMASACRALLRTFGESVQQRRTGTDRVPRALRAAGVTAREHEVLELLVHRLTNRAIADRLHISPRTVEKHVAALIMKTHRTDRTALSEHAGHLLADEPTG